MYTAAIVPLYNGETAPKALRGTLLVLYQLQIIIGYVRISYFTAQTILIYVTFQNLPELPYRPGHTYN